MHVVAPALHIDIARLLHKDPVAARLHGDMAGVVCKWQRFFHAGRFMMDGNESDADPDQERLTGTCVAKSMRSGQHLVGDHERFVDRAVPDRRSANSSPPRRASVSLSRT